MACVPVQCISPPCPQICDGQILTDSPSTVTGPFVNTTLPYRNIDPALLMYAPETITRNPGTYSGGQYPSGRGISPNFSIDTESLDYWRFVLLALGVIIGAMVIKRL
jgi:hypothetical protein